MNRSKKLTLTHSRGSEEATAGEGSDQVFHRSAVPVLWLAKLAELTFIKIAAKVSKEPNLTDAAACSNGRFAFEEMNMAQSLADRAMSSQMCFLDGSRSCQQSPPYFFDVLIVRTATPAKDIHFRMSPRMRFAQDSLASAGPKSTGCEQLIM